MEQMPLGTLGRFPGMGARYKEVREARDRIPKKQHPQSARMAIWSPVMSSTCHPSFKNATCHYYSCIVSRQMQNQNLGSSYSSLHLDMLSYVTAEEQPHQPH